MMDIYFNFDYFSTPTRDLWVHKLNIEKYGLTSKEVYDYISQMEKDRISWLEKRRKYDDLGFYIHLFVSFFALPIILIMGKMLICTIMGIYEEDEEGIVNKLLSLITMFLFFRAEYDIWKNETIIELFDNWIDKKFQKRSQYNSVIEKLLDDANFENWKYKNSIK